ncbi:hypothetical protein MARBORIA2_10700 [Methanobrevibacter arboriphilus]|uniref:Uncharacterized protein n=1 Tax=Methanobrevibacter arboriphilus TaxID=39441 RepID=A0ACA8R5U7_METAZ|nr:hypothetical protein [Methanobrevibacter arboriphilus]MCC7561840.1 hypothetical protein [Methanobrevibacter arboriphilus]BBL62740.1 hypothetical protein MarbSA_17800 [Methanobrevibacter arboriphilus]GLI11980.1 hypothetical protein MARBORIA2_10700 [Methanobrevibacter arboriphilus]
MYKKFFLILILSFFILVSFSAVHATNNNEDNNQTIDNTSSSLNVNSSSSNSTSTNFKTLNKDKNKIEKITKSKSVFKTGTKIRINVYTVSSIKKVQGYITGKKTFKFKKNNNGIWYYYLNTKKFKSGKYKVSVRAFDSKNNIYKKYTNFTVDNKPPKVVSVKSSAKSVIAGRPFCIVNIADSSSKKVIAKIKGNKYYFKFNGYIDNKKLKNYKNWTLNTKINYKVLGTLNISVYTFDSAGNYLKNNIYVKSIPYYVKWNQTVLLTKPIQIYYSNPKNAYERSINELSKYVNVYEGCAGTNYTLGITYNNGIKATRVIIAYMDPFVVYHEMGHVLNWKWTEYQCDYYAYKRTGYWIK